MSLTISFYQHTTFNKNIAALDDPLRVVCAENIALNVPKQFHNKIRLKPGTTDTYELVHTPSIISGEITISIKGLIRTQLQHEDFTRLFTYPADAVTGDAPSTKVDIFDSVDINYGYLQLKNCQCVSCNIDTVAGAQYVYIGAVTWKAHYIKPLTTVNNN